MGEMRGRCGGRDGGPSPVDRSPAAVVAGQRRQSSRQGPPPPFWERQHSSCLKANRSSVPNYSLDRPQASSPRSGSCGGTRALRWRSTLPRTTCGSSSRTRAPTGSRWARRIVASRGRSGSRQGGTVWGCWVRTAAAPACLCALDLMPLPPSHQQTPTGVRRDLLHRAPPGRRRHLLARWQGLH